MHIFKYLSFHIACSQFNLDYSNEVIFNFIIIVDNSRPSILKLVALIGIVTSFCNQSNWFHSQTKMVWTMTMHTNWLWILLITFYAFHGIRNDSRLIFCCCFEFKWIGWTRVEIFKSIEFEERNLYFRRRMGQIPKSIDVICTTFPLFEKKKTKWNSMFATFFKFSSYIQYYEDFIRYTNGHFQQHWINKSKKKYLRLKFSSWLIEWWKESSFNAMRVEKKWSK